jgi:hypothetical protein
MLDGEGRFQSTVAGLATATPGKAPVRMHRDLSGQAGLAGWLAALGPSVGARHSCRGLLASDSHHPGGVTVVPGPGSRSLFFCSRLQRHSELCIIVLAKRFSQRRPPRAAAISFELLASQHVKAASSTPPQQGKLVCRLCQLPYLGLLPVLPLFPCPKLRR